MKKTIAILFLSITYLLMGCANDEKKQVKQKLDPVNKLQPASAQVFTKTPVKANKNLSYNFRTKKKSDFSNKGETEIKPEIQNVKNLSERKNVTFNEEENKSLMTFSNLKKILTLSKIGQTLDHKQLMENFEIPREAVKLVKSITRTSEDEIAIKWRSTWLVEKMSDAKFQDGLMKITFKANKLYTSGTAIGIKYDKKIHNELVIVGRSAYIPGVKGYSWQIGK
jgi:hypothetical protein